MSFATVFDKDFTGVANAAAGAAMSVVGGAPSIGANAGGMIDLVGGKWSIAAGRAVSPDTVDAPLLVPTPAESSIRVTAWGRQGDQISPPIYLRALDGQDTTGRGTSLYFNVGLTYVQMPGGSFTGLTAFTGFTESILQVEVNTYLNGSQTYTVRVWPIAGNPLTDAPVYSVTTSGTAEIGQVYAVEIGNRITSLKQVIVETDPIPQTLLPPASAFPATFPELAKLSGKRIVGVGQFAWPTNLVIKPGASISGTVTMERDYPAPGTTIANPAIGFANHFGTESTLPTANLFFEASLILPSLSALPAGVVGYPFAGGGFIVPFVFTGGDRATILPGSVGVGEIANLVMPNAPYKIRYYLEGQQIPCQTSYPNGLSNAIQATMAGANVVRNTATAATLGLVGGWSDPSPCPLGLWGVPDRDLGGTAVFGDSKGNFIGSKLIAAGVPMLYLGMSGDTLMNLAGAGGRLRRALPVGARNAVNQLGINDLAPGGQNGITTFRRLIRFVDGLAPGPRIIACTVDARTGGVYTTLTGQTHTTTSTPGGETNEYNNYVRQLPFVWDVAAITHDAATGKWLPNLTADGVHYNAAGILVAQAAVDLSLLFVPTYVAPSDIPALVVAQMERSGGTLDLTLAQASLAADQSGREYLATIGLTSDGTIVNLDETSVGVFPPTFGGVVGLMLTAADCGAQYLVTGYNSGTGVLSASAVAPLTLPFAEAVLDSYVWWVSHGPVETVETREILQNVAAAVGTRNATETSDGDTLTQVYGRPDGGTLTKASTVAGNTRTMTVTTVPGE
jgi:hypothetical protein